MRWSETLILIFAVLAIVLVLIWLAASRLDRLHRKVVSARLALDAQLVRRSSSAFSLAASGYLDPSSSILVAQAAHDASGDENEGTHELVIALPDLTPKDKVEKVLEAGLSDGRTQAESQLSLTLRTALDDPEELSELYENAGASEMLNEVASAWYRVQLARRFYNEAVSQTIRVRKKRLVRFFHLAGNAPMPAMMEFDDAWPSALREASRSPLLDK